MRKLLVVVIAAILIGTGIWFQIKWPQEEFNKYIFVSFTSQLPGVDKAELNSDVTLSEEEINALTPDQKEWYAVYIRPPYSEAYDCWGYGYENSPIPVLRSRCEEKLRPVIFAEGLASVLGLIPSGLLWFGLLALILIARTKAFWEVVTSFSYALWTLIDQSTNWIVAD